MENTAQNIQSVIPASLLFERAIAGDTLPGSEVLLSLQTDIGKGYMVGAQSILTLVCDNPSMSNQEIEALIATLENALSDRTQLDKNIASGYEYALSLSKDELDRRRNEKVVAIR